MTTCTDFAKWELRAKGMTDDMLRHTIADCRAAEVAMRDHNPDRECFYSDQAATYSDALRRRTNRKGR